MITEDILKKYGVEPTDDLEKNEDGTYKLDVALEKIVTHVQSMKAQDPDLIKSLKEQGLKEGTKIANKRVFKTFRDKFNLQFSNAEIDEIEPEKLAEMVHELQNARSTEDVAKLQDDIMKLANENQSLKDSYENKVKEIERSYAERDRIQKQKDQVTKLYRNPDLKLSVSEDVALMVFESRLKADGYIIKFDEKGEPKVYDGEHIALNDTKTSPATIQYLAEKYWNDIRQVSNGSGGQGSTSSQRPINNNILDQDATFKALESKYNRRRGG